MVKPTLRAATPSRFPHTHLVRGGLLMLQPSQALSYYPHSLHVGRNITNPPLTRWVFGAEAFIRRLGAVGRNITNPPLTRWYVRKFDELHNPLLRHLELRRRFRVR